jgi:hypothetical protein
MGQRYLAEQWAAWIGEQAESGLTIAAFCGAIGVSENSFYVWRRKLRAAEASATGRRGAAASRDRSTARAGDGDVVGAGGSPTETAAAGFVELMLTGGGSGCDGTRSGVEVDLPCGAVVRVPRDAVLLEQVLSVLLAADSSEMKATASGHSRRGATQAGGASC